MNRQKGNMYIFVSNTWNHIKGICPHKCKYCYMRNYWKRMKPPRLEKKELHPLPENIRIFVGSGIDMFAQDIPSEWIHTVLKHCNKYSNEYLFQSKNPRRFTEFITEFPPKTILGTTIETNRYLPTIYEGICPSIDERLFFLGVLSRSKAFKTMITVEPIIDFDHMEFKHNLIEAKPCWVNFGSDSKNSNLPEPTPSKINKLIEELRPHLRVEIKSNLRNQK